MDRRYLFLIVFLSMLGAYAGLHYALASYLAQLFPGFPAYVVVLALGLSSIACLFLIHWRRNLLTQSYYLLGVTWMGVAFIGFFLVLLFQLLTYLTGVRPAGGLVLGTLSIIVVYGVFNAFSPRVREVDIRVRKPLKRPLRIVQLSDIHMGEIHRAPFLRGIVRRTNALKPDVVVITGDLFDGGEVYPHIIDELKGLRQRNVLFVTGNHEVYTGSKRTTGLVRKLGIRVLDNEVVTIRGVQFVGMSEPERDDQKATLRKLGTRVSRSRPSVLLRHTPHDNDLAARSGFDVQLSGHTHRGQIWPFTLLTLLLFRPAAGIWRKGSYTLYISQGTGTWGPPMRIGSRSEITLIVLAGRER